MFRSELYYAWARFHMNYWIILTNKDDLITVQTPPAIRFWHPPIWISPSAANCWTASRTFIIRVPKHRRLDKDAIWSISAVRHKISCALGGALYIWAFSFWNLNFWLSERSVTLKSPAPAEYQASNAFVQLLFVTWYNLSRTSFLKG